MPDGSVCQVLPWTLRNGALELHYATPVGRFTESITFPVDIPDSGSTRRVIDLLAMVASVSYAKAAGRGAIDMGELPVTAAAATLLEGLFDEGMREFAHQNNLDLRSTFTTIARTSATASASPPPATDRSVLVPMGGGRDSAVVATALSQLQPVLMSVGSNPHAASIAERLSRPLMVVTRTIDPALIALNASGAPNGHVPVTAINSLIALVLAGALGTTMVAMANEASASAPTRVHRGTPINHQYSKSMRCESDIRAALDEAGSGIEYFSVLRNRSDAEIARVFMEKCAPLHTAFMSCNRAMIRDAARRSDGWCTECPKCLSVFLSLAPHTTPAHMVEMFGADLLDDPGHIAGFAALLDPGDKPFECVGDVAEAQLAMTALRDDPRWQGHAVVSQVAFDPVPATAPGTDHHMPPDVARTMETFFS